MRLSLGFLGISLISSLVIGCAPAPYRQSNYEQSNYQPAPIRVSSKLTDSLNASVEAYKTCLANVYASPSGSIVFKEVLFKTLWDSNREAFMSSQAMLSPSQSKALIETLPQLKKCSDNRLAAMKDYPTVIDAYKLGQEKLDATYSNLINKKISIGKANTLRYEIMDKSLDRTTAALAALSMQERLELEQRQRTENAIYQNQQNMRSAQSQPQQVQQPPTAYEEALIRQMQYQNIQNSIQQLTAPKIIAPTPTYTNQNQNPFYQAPQQPLTNPSVNCVPNGVGGFRCQ